MAKIAFQKAQCEAQLAEEKRSNRDIKEQSDLRLAAERHKNAGLQQKLAAQVWQLEGAVRERERLRLRVQELELQKKTTTGCQGTCINQPTLVRQVAEMECRPLLNQSLQVQIALKKKLLVKWHPDKQPSSDHSVFATRVMQEMQNRREWQT
jgi:hypothetical protein